MNERFKTAALKTRVISAIAAVVALIFIGWKFHAFGLQILVGFAIVLLVHEYLKMSLLPLKSPPLFILWYLICAVGVFASVIRNDESLLLATACVTAFTTVSLWLTRNRMSNEKLLSALSLGVLGYFICVIFPSYLIQTLRLPNGLEWFCFHLLMVFAGDVAAYFGGITWGRDKIMPQISPKKTVAGSITGLAGSFVVALLFAGFFLKNSVWWHVGVYALVCGFAAQMGDLLLSLVKRVADVKDSGGIMPGHGGALDRVDGVIVTAPLLYAFASAAETWLT